MFLFKSHTYDSNVDWIHLLFFFFACTTTTTTTTKTECLQQCSWCNIDAIIRSYRIDWAVFLSFSFSLVYSNVCIRALYFFLIVAIEWAPSNKNESMLLLQPHILIHGSCGANSKKEEKEEEEEKEKRKKRGRKRGREKKESKRNTAAAAYSMRELCACVCVRIRSRHCPVKENEWATGTT